MRWPSARSREGGNTTACGEDWTIIVVTDHGHQPQPGFGHGFQSPGRQRHSSSRTARNSADSVVQPGLRDRRCHTDRPEPVRRPAGPQIRRCSAAVASTAAAQILLNQAQLEDALEAQIASNDYPNIIINVALSVRTIVAFVPYTCTARVCLPRSATSCTSRRMFPRRWSRSEPACTASGCSRSCRRRRRSRSYRMRRRRSTLSFAWTAGATALLLRGV